MDDEKVKSAFTTLIKNWKPLLYVALAIAIAVFVASISFLAKSRSTGETIGKKTGTIVGKASGSYDGWNEGYEKGKEEGLSAKDTTVTVQTTLSETGTLRVLSAKVLVNNAHEVGAIDKDSFVSSLIGGKKYSAIYSYEGQVDFLIDLSKATITSGDGKTIIELPEPQASLIIDERTAELIGDNQKPWLNGSDHDGIVAYNNSVAAIKKQTAESLANYNSLLQRAKASAQRQVEDLVKAVNISHDEPIVRFMN